MMVDPSKTLQYHFTYANMGLQNGTTYLVRSFLEYSQISLTNGECVLKFKNVKGGNYINLGYGSNHKVCSTTLYLLTIILTMLSLCISALACY